MKKSNWESNELNRNRSISNILGEKSTSSQPSSSSKLVLCNCPKYNRRLIDSRTKVIHDLFNESSEISIESFQNQQEIEEIEISKKTADDKVSNISSKDEMKPISVEISKKTADDKVSNISSKDEMKVYVEEKSADEFSNIFEDYSSSNYNLNEPIDPKLTNNNSYL
ncbi:hypothetical protein Glove_478g83 [Diversispora epigaea]|uniref:Uncharacterized protein n=1 Tax=Diversispora epigaea TaxID=1348612 RepID=A0A397GLM7_9GLOM|nr:hypothetical protein Glove_478g83 [Diversispora epigaea]